MRVAIVFEIPNTAATVNVEDPKQRDRDEFNVHPPQMRIKCFIAVE